MKERAAWGEGAEAAGCAACVGLGPAPPPEAHLRPSSPDRCPIVTATDPQGRITYANAAFLRSAGLEMSQVIGAPHSIVRHPEMPERVFADLWRTLAEGRAWTGLIRNRDGRGGDFWVKANVMPARSGADGAAAGFTSVQLPPTPHEQQRAERVYRLWGQGGARRQAIRRGRIVATGWAAWLAALRNPFDLPVQRRVQGSAGLLAMLFAGAFAAALWPAEVALLLAPLGGWQLWALLGAGLGVAASAAIAVYFQLRIVRPLSKALRDATAIAGGDIHRLFDDGPAAGELRDLDGALNQLVARMAAVLRDADEHAGQVRQRVGDLADGAGQLAVSAAGQSVNLGEVAAAAAGIDALCTRTVGASHEAHAAVQRAVGEADEACAIAATLQATMGHVAGFGRRIADVSGRIDAIAMQTGILALNAAAAASRDAELGRTFSVVAGEVRALAQRSGEAAQQIRALSEESRQSTEAALRLAVQMGGKVEDAAARVRDMGRLVAHMREAAQAQSAEVAQIDQRLRALEGAAQDNALLAQQGVIASAHAADAGERLRAALRLWHLG